MSLINGRTKPPRTHSLLFHFSRKGYKGSERLWKLVTKYVAFPEDGSEVYLPDGFLMKFDSHDWISLSIYKGQYEHEVVDFLQLISPTDLVIDVGANIGYTLWKSLKNARKDCRAIAVEPSERCFARLMRLSNAIPHPLEISNSGLGGEISVNRLYESTNTNHSGAGTFITGFATDEGIDVSVTTLDALLQESELSTIPISVCKIDTEGFEAEVLRGAKSTFQTNLPEILLIEISPEYGSIGYVEELWRIFDEGYEFAALTLQRGWIRTRPKIRRIDRDAAMRAQVQFNLAIFRHDLRGRFECLR